MNTKEFLTKSAAFLGFSAFREAAAPAYEACPLPRKTILPRSLEEEQRQLRHLIEEEPIDLLATALLRLRTHPDFDVNSRLFITGESLLHLAVRRAVAERDRVRYADRRGEDWYEMISLLLDHGADPGILNREKLSPLDLAVRHLAPLSVNELTGRLSMISSPGGDFRKAACPTAQTLEILADHMRHKSLLNEDQKNDLALIETIFNSKFPDIMLRFAARR